MQKKCRTCKELKDRDEWFHKAKAASDGRSPNCKVCVSLKMGYVPRFRRAPPSGPPKACTCCKEIKAASEFYRNRSKPDGLGVYCKSCWNGYLRSNREEKRVAVTEKWCNRCDKTLPAERFGSDKQRLDSLALTCKDCIGDFRREQMAGRLGCSVEQYRRIVAEANGLCMICRKPPLVKSLALDHDHVTHKVRGLLCLHCNILIGQAKDNISVLEAAITYLKKHQTLESVEVPNALPETI